MAITIRHGLILTLFCAGCSTAGREVLGTTNSVPTSRHAVVRVTTDAHEKIVDVAVIESSGSSALDRYIVADTRDYWHGAVNSIENVAVKYKPGPDGKPQPVFEPKLR